MTCGCGSQDMKLSDEQKQILKAIANADGPCGSKDIAAVTGLEKKEISSKITALKKKGLVDSPVRCKYGVTENGKAAIV